MSNSTEKNRVLLGVTGSIAAYKSVEIARLLISRGFQVRVVMSESAQEFVAPLTFSAVTGHAVVTNFWVDDSEGQIQHISLADWADVMLIAPATADFLAKYRMGIADSPLLAMALATRAPVLVAPAMNVNMLEHAATQENIAVLRERGVELIDPGEGALACGWHGSGRMAEPQEVFYHTLRALSPGDFRGKRVLIATGPTREPIDPVRFVSNRSSGKMGVALAREAFRRGAEVTMVHGPIEVEVPQQVRALPVMTALEMRDVVLAQAFPAEEELSPDIVIMTAAVSDFRPVSTAAQKIKKGKAKKSISLVENPDILAELGEQKGASPRPLLVGFAVETGEIDDLIDEVNRKLKGKNADMIVGNFAEDAFDLDTNRVWLIDRYGKQEEVATSFKSRVAVKIFNSLLNIGF